MFADPYTGPTEIIQIHQQETLLGTSKVLSFPSMGSTCLGSTGPSTVSQKEVRRSKRKGNGNKMKIANKSRVGEPQAAADPPVKDAPLTTKLIKKGKDGTMVLCNLCRDWF